MNGTSNKVNTTQGANADSVQAKLAALLDDVTSGAGAVAETAATGAHGQPERVSPAAARPFGGPALTSPAPSAEVAQIAAQIKSMQAAAGVSVEPVRPPGAAPNSSAVIIKGRGDGIAIELGKGNWPELLEQLRERLAHAANFFRGASVAIDVGLRPLLEGELNQLRALMEEHDMRLGVVRTGDERTFETAIALGLPAKLVAADGAAEAEVEVANANVGPGQYFIYHGNLRSGQVLERREHILVLGDVNPGAAVISQGDILVWGRMRGIAHAGAAGDRKSVVLALHLEPIQLHIAGIVAIDVLPAGRGGNRWSRKAGEKRPEIAHLTADQVVIEPWDESKPGGLAAFRR